MSEVQSPFGPRRVRTSVAGMPPQSADLPPSSSATVSSPFGPRKVGSSTTATDGPSSSSSNSVAPAQGGAGASASIFGPRVGNRAGQPQAAPFSSGSGAPAEPSASPFGAVLRSRTQPPSTSSASPPVAKAAELSQDAGRANRTVPFPNLEKIEALLLWRRSQLHTMRLRITQSIALIQSEYRKSLAALGRDAEERTRTRRRRLAWLQERLRQRAEVALEGRQHGGAIADEEAREWLLIVASASSLKRREVERREEEWRQKILDTESNEFHAQFRDELRSAIPAFLRPGTVEHDEMVLRCHVAQYFRFSLQRLARRAVAERAGIMLLDEQRLRRGVLEAESVVRVQLLREMRFDYFLSRLFELDALERRLRSVREAQAVQLMHSVVRQTAALRAIHLSCDDPGRGGTACEIYHRRGIEAKESFYRRQLEEGFLSQRYFLTFAIVQREEYQGRCGAGGIEAKERREWKAIAYSWSATLLARLQGNWDTAPAQESVPPAARRALEGRIRENVYCDTSTEPGSRITIEIAEARERRTIEASLSLDAVAVFFPPVESRSRHKIAYEEERERRKLMDSMHVLPLLFCTQSEPVARRRIDNQWQLGTVQLMVEYAKLRLQGNELRLRAHCLQNQELHWDRIQAHYYLCLVEIEERQELQKAHRVFLNAMSSRASPAGRTRTTRSVLSSPSPKGTAIAAWHEASSVGDGNGDESPFWVHRGGSDEERHRQPELSWRSPSDREGTAAALYRDSSLDWMRRTVHEATRSSQRRDGSATKQQTSAASPRETGVPHRAVSEHVTNLIRLAPSPGLLDRSPRSRLHGAHVLDADESLDGHRVVTFAPLAAGLLQPTLRVTPTAASPRRSETLQEKAVSQHLVRPESGNVYLRDPNVASLVGPYLARERIHDARLAAQPQLARGDPPPHQTVLVRGQSPIRASSPTLFILPPRVATRWE